MTDLTIDLDKTLSKLTQMSVADLIEQISKYPVVTRRLLLIRPLRGTDQGEIYLNKVADAVKLKAQDGNWDIIDLQGDKATKQAILDALANKKPDFVMHFGHSVSSNIGGQENGQLVQAITPQNAHVLAGKAVIVNACLTASTVGPAAIAAKTRAYVGFNNLLTSLHYDQEVEDDCTEALAIPNLALLNGATFEDAWQNGWDTWDAKWKKWTAFCQQQSGKLTPTGQAFCAMGPAALLDNRNRFERLGQKKAVARPIGIVANK